jgi:imidazolonepropionase-like amidohydrolase
MGESFTIIPPVIRASRLGLAAAGLLVLACQQEPDGVALLGATLIDGMGGSALRDAAIVVRRGKVESVRSRASFQLPKRTREVYLSGRWIIPGLIDVHTHLQPTADWAPGRYLAWGVTTVRDVHGTLNSTLALRKRLNVSPPVGPRVYSAGAMIDGLPATFPDAIGANGEKDARQGVDRLVSAGADLIKVYTRIDAPQLRAIVDESRAFHLGVAAHLGMTDAVAAAKAGVASIEHMSGVPEAASSNPSSLYTAHYRGFFPGWSAFERRWAELDLAALRRVARQLADAKVTIVPTLVLHETLSRLDDPAALRDSAFREVPDAQRSEWDVPGLIARTGWTGADFEAFRASRANQDFFVRAFATAGGRLATGSDAANQLLVPGYSQHREMELLVRAGLTAKEALRAATRNGAVLLGADSLGLLVPGKVADLVVLTRDPLADIRNTRAIQSVMSRGYLLDADSMRATW